MAEEKKSQLDQITEKVEKLNRALEDLLENLKALEEYADWR